MKILKISQITFHIPLANITKVQFYSCQVYLFLIIFLQSLKIRSTNSALLNTHQKILQLYWIPLTSLTTIIHLSFYCKCHDLEKCQARCLNISTQPAGPLLKEWNGGEWKWNGNMEWNGMDGRNGMEWNGMNMEWNGTEWTNEQEWTERTGID